jgi:hypothetical protein
MLAHSSINRDDNTPYIWCDILRCPEHDQYQRNNKSEHSKRLRCFPNCCTEGHKTSGFCGTGIEILLRTKM